LHEFGASAHDRLANFKLAIAKELQNAGPRSE
jgi:hypothetical protein